MIKINAKRLRDVVAEAVRPGVPGHIFDSAAVFLLLFEQNGPHVLAILKADTEGYPWRNQVALPGGHVDKIDTGPKAAAYRELKEEMNIPAGQVDFIGSLGHFQTINRKDVEVFLGLWDGKGPVDYARQEIARVLEIPLAHLVETHAAAGFHGRQPGVDRLIYPFEDVQVWGLTAKIFHFFIELIHPLWRSQIKGRVE
jgi:8-oxo-dGTP pyrophosphatase MutT (NUDIX family)